MTMKLAKFQELLNKSFASGLDFAHDPSDPDRRRYFVRSTKDTARFYITTPTTCSCQAGQFGNPCQHRARIMYESGAYLKRHFVITQDGNDVDWSVESAR
jgi:hypothetical protein